MRKYHKVLNNIYIYIIMQRIGSRAQVMHGNAKMTGGGLMKKDLTYNKAGKIVSKKMSKMAKKEMRLQKAGYITTKGVFGVKKMSGGAKVSSFIFDNIKVGVEYLLVEGNDYINAVSLIVKEKGDLMIEYTLNDTVHRTTRRVFKSNIQNEYKDYYIKTKTEVLLQNPPSSYMTREEEEGTPPNRIPIQYRDNNRYQGWNVSEQNSDTVYNASITVGTSDFTQRGKKLLETAKTNESKQRAKTIIKIISDLPEIMPNNNKRQKYFEYLLTTEEEREAKLNKAKLNNKDPNYYEKFITGYSIKNKL